MRKKHKHCKLYGGNPIYPCKRQHGNGERNDRAHFHCPVCWKTVSPQPAFIKHLAKHLPQQARHDVEMSEACKDRGDIVDAGDVYGLQHEVGQQSQNQAEPAGVKQKPTEEEQQGDEEETNVSDQEVAEVTQCKRDRPSKSVCPVCNKGSHPKSLARHCREIHAWETVSMATCVDEEGGPFLVRNSCHGGVGYPIHVKKVMGKEHGVQCEVKECIDYMRVAWKSGLKTAVCRHLQAVDTKCVFPAETELVPDSLQDLSASGSYRMFTNDRVEECIALAACAGKAKSRCFVPVRESKRFTHFPVYDGDVHYYSRFGRVVVTVDLMCLWYLRQEDPSENFRAMCAESGDESGEEVDNEVVLAMCLLCACYVL